MKLEYKSDWKLTAMFDHQSQLSKYVQFVEPLTIKQEHAILPALTLAVFVDVAGTT